MSSSRTEARAGRPRSDPSDAASPRPRRGFARDLASRFGFFLVLIVKISLLCTLVFALSALVSFWIIRHQLSGGEIIVPGLAGQTVAQAIQTLQDEGVDLSIKLEEMEYSDLAGENEILSQLPPAGTRVKAGATVRVRVSRGGERVPCPDLIGTNFLEAGMVLREADLREGSKSFLASASAERDAVIAQDPPPGRPLDRETPVNLLISLGPVAEPVLMPDLSGSTVPEAEDLLAQLDLEIDKVSTAPFSGKDNGLIFRQEPVAGSPVSPGAAIRVTAVDNLGVAR